MADEKTIKIKAEVQDSYADAFDLEKHKLAPSADKAIKQMTGTYQKAIEQSVKHMEKLNHKMEKMEAKYVALRRAKAGKVPSEDEGDEESGSKKETKEKTFMGKILSSFQKVIYALNGANGRYTKTIAVVTRAVDGATSALGKFTQKTNEAANPPKGGNPYSPNGPIAGGGRGGIANFLSKVAGLLGNFGKVLLKVGVVVGAVVGAMVALRLAAALTSEAIEKMGNVVGGLSGLLNKEKARNKALEIRERLAAANKIGPELAELERVKGDLDREAIRNDANLVKITAPFVKLAAKVETGLLKMENAVLDKIGDLYDGISNLGGLLTSLNETSFQHAKKTGEIHTNARTFAEYQKLQDVKKQLKESRDRHKDVEDLFVPDQFFGNNVPEQLRAFL